MKQEKYYELWLLEKSNKFLKTKDAYPSSVNTIMYRCSAGKTGYCIIVPESKINIGKRKLLLFALKEAKEILKQSERSVNAIRRLYAACS